MKKIFFLAAVIITAVLGFTACDKEDIDENFDFSHTSWESSIDDDEVSVTLTLSFKDDKNGLIKGDFEDNDSKKYTAYQTFTYEAGMGKDFIGKIQIYQSSIYPPQSKVRLVDENQLYPVIQNPDTVVYYAESNHTTVMYYLQFDADEYNAEYGIYNATFTGADGNLIFSGYMEKK